MFWQCCRRSNGEYPTNNGQDISKKQNKNGNTLLLSFFVYTYCYFFVISAPQESYGMDVRPNTISNDLNGNGSIPTATNVGRIRTQSSSSIKSSESFYSVKSSATSAGAEGDFYSVCSVDSFKST